MSRKLMVLAIVPLIAVMIVPSVFAAEGDELEAIGTVTEVDAVAGTLTLSVEDEEGNSSLVTVILPDDFDYGSVAVGDTLEVSGLEAADGSLIAEEITVTVEEEEEAEENETEETETESDENVEEDEVTTEETASNGQPTGQGGGPPCGTPPCGRGQGNAGGLLDNPAAGLIEQQFDVPGDEVLESVQNGSGGEGLGQAMMAARLEGWLTNLGWNSAQLLSWREGGQGWGHLIAANKWADRLPANGDTLLEMRASGMGWGQIKRELGVTGAGNVQGGGPPGGVPPGQARKTS